MITQLIAETKVVEDVKDKSLDVYPNPANSYFIVYDYSAEQSRHIELLDMNGKLVKRQTALNIATRMDVGDLSNGLYILRITDAKGKLIRTEKIVIQR